MRLKNVQLSYNLPETLTNKVGLSNVRIYVNALNLFTIEKDNVFDPEATAGSGVFYPQSRVVNTGLSLTF